jgi:hypothetical protein
MDAARRVEMSRKGKQRWKDCEAIAEKLDITKYQVSSYLYGDIAQADKLELAKAGDSSTMDWIKTTPGWKRMLQDKQNEEEQAERIRLHKPSRKVDNDMPETADEKLRVAMWYLRKMGSFEDAKAALEIAHSATERLGRKTSHVQGQ